MPRLTISLNDDLYAMVRAHAVANHLSLSKAVGDLLRRRNGPAPASADDCMVREESDPSLAVDPRSGFPVVKGSGRPITSEDVRRAEGDEDIRHLELMGLSPKEIERALDR